MFYNFISHTPVGIFFIDTHTHTHCRLLTTKVKTHLVAINRLNPSRPAICENNLERTLAVSISTNRCL